MPIGTPTQRLAWERIAFGANSASFSISSSTNVVTAHVAISYTGSLPSNVSISGGIGNGTIVATSVQGFGGGMRVYRWYNVAAGSYTISPAGSGTDVSIQVIETADAASVVGSTTAQDTNSVVLTSATGRAAVVAGQFENAPTSPNQTLLGSTVNLVGYHQSAQRADGAASVTFSWTHTGISDLVAYDMNEAAGDTLSVDTQPSTATSGVAMSNVIIDSSDTGSTATVTAAIQTGGGVLSGTTSGAMTAGTVTFSNLIITGSGAHTLRFTASGHSSVDSTTITVSGASLAFRPYYITG